MIAAVFDAIDNSGDGFYVALAAIVAAVAIADRIVMRRLRA